ncbi:MAG: winged helix-turn-helix domain-containing protein [Actinomycetota bacterium]|nr:winged helix-turn-helix domain-containing protein [Actinomycetota bacterium]
MKPQLEQLQWAFKALSCKKRLQILKLLLTEGEMTVGEISEKLEAICNHFSESICSSKDGLCDK